MWWTTWCPGSRLLQYLLDKSCLGSCSFSWWSLYSSPWLPPTRGTFSQGSCLMYSSTLGPLRPGGAQEYPSTILLQHSTPRGPPSLPLSPLHHPLLLHSSLSSSFTPPPSSTSSFPPFSPLQHPPHLPLFLFHPSTILFLLSLLSSFFTLSPSYSFHCILGRVQDTFCCKPLTPCTPFSLH